MSPEYNRQNRFVGSCVLSGILSFVHISQNQGNLCFFFKFLLFFKLDFGWISTITLFPPQETQQPVMELIPDFQDCLYVTLQHFETLQVCVAVWVVSPSISGEQELRVDFVPSQDVLKVYACLQRGNEKLCSCDHSVDLRFIMTWIFLHPVWSFVASESSRTVHRTCTELWNPPTTVPSFNQP